VLGNFCIISGSMGTAFEHFLECILVSCHDVHCVVLLSASTLQRDDWALSGTRICID
jgi:hypothetical protein